MTVMNVLDYSQIEPRIRPHVKALRDAGFETTQSCGHEMYVNIALPLHRLPDLRDHLLAAGYRDFDVSYIMHSYSPAWDGAKVQFRGALEGDGGPRDLILLKVDPEAHPLYFVIQRRNYDNGHDGVPGHDAYFYDEHTCPTNWTDEIVAVISKGDEDPHGFATFVRRIPVPEGMDENGDMKDGHDGALWTTIFPETLK